MSLCVTSQKNWFAEELPGLFSKGLVDGHLPTCEFITLKKMEPVPSKQCGSAARPSFLNILGLTYNSSAWKCVAMPGLKFVPTGEDQDCLRYHTTMAIRESDCAEVVQKYGNTEPRYARISYVDNLVPSLLCFWSIRTVLEGYSRQMSEVVSSEMIWTVHSQKPVQALRLLSGNIGLGTDAMSVMSDLLGFGLEALVSFSVEPFKPCLENRFPKELSLDAFIYQDVKRFAKWLQNAEIATRDYLTQRGSILAAASVLVLTRIIAWLTIAIAILTVILSRDELVSWLQDFARWPSVAQIALSWLHTVSWFVVKLVFAAMVDALLP